VPADIFTPTGVTAPALVIISPGFQMARTQYTSYAHHMATWGFEVILTDYADQSLFADHQLLANDVGAVITYALANTPADSTKIAVAGHSLGGDVSVLAATGDPRIKAVVGWDPVDGSPAAIPKMTSFTAKLAVIGETTDGSGGFMPCAPTADNYDQFYTAAPSPAYEMTVVGADHMDWVDDGSCAFCTLCTAGTASPDLAHTTTRRLNVAWLRQALFADAGMQPWLIAPPEVAAGTASIQHK
jgi:dienelactone hydrolase